MKADSALFLSILLAGMVAMGGCEDKGPDTSSMEVINQLDIPVRVVWTGPKSSPPPLSFDNTRNRGRTVEPGGSTKVSALPPPYSEDRRVTITVRTEEAEKEFKMEPEERILVLTDDNFP